MSRPVFERVTALALTALLAIAVLVPAVAVAAPAPIRSLSAVLHDDGTDPVFIISASLPTATPLPATLVLPVPAGTTVSWAGQIMGADPGADIEVQPVVATGPNGWGTATLTLTKSRIGQIELAMPAAITRDGASVLASATLLVPVAVEEASLSLRIPQQAQVATFQPGMVEEPGPAGYRYLTRQLDRPKVGTLMTAVALYSGGAAAAAAPVAASAAQPGGGPAVWIIVGVVLVAMAGFAYAVSRRMGTARDTGDGDDAEAAADDAFEAAVPAHAPKPARTAKVAASAPDVTLADAVDPAESGAPRRMSPGALLFGSVAVCAALIFGGFVVASQPEKIPQATAGAQRVKVDSSKGDFNPAEIRVKAGVPVEIEFPPGGSGCSGRFTLERFAIDQDLSRGALVRLPALEPGTYPFKGGCGSESGSVIAE